MIFNKINEFKGIFIGGIIGSGKTALVFKMLENANKKVYFLRHPKPELLKPFGYENLLSLEQLEYVQDCFVYWDEPQLYLSVADYKRNQIILKVLSLARQRNITFIISSSDTRTFTKGTESYFDLWIVKDIEYEMVKQRSQIKKIIKDNCFISPEDFHLNQDEFLVYNRKYRELNGKFSFELPKGWSNELSCPFSIQKPKLAENLLKTDEKLIENSQKTHETDEKLLKNGDKSMEIYSLEKEKPEEIQKVKYK